ncbi:unnamed protein product, partial [Ascophyllum nodosum]
RLLVQWKALALYDTRDDLVVWLPRLERGRHACVTYIESFPAPRIRRGRQRRWRQRFFVFQRLQRPEVSHRRNIIVIVGSSLPVGFVSQLHCVHTFLTAV